MGEQPNEQAQEFPKVEVRASESKRGNFRFIIDMDGAGKAMAPINDTYKTAKAALASGQELVDAIKGAAQVEGYKVGHEKGFAAGQRTGKREGAEAAKVEANRAHEEAVGSLRADHAKQLDDVRSQCTRERDIAVHAATNRATTRGWVWGTVTMLVLGVILTTLLDWYGMLDRMLG